MGWSSQDRQLFDTISLLIQGSLEGELKLMDELAGPGGQPSAFPSVPSPGGSDPQVTVPCAVPPPLTVPSCAMLCYASGVAGVLPAHGIAGQKQPRASVECQAWQAAVRGASRLRASSGAALEGTS